MRISIVILAMFALGGVATATDQRQPGWYDAQGKTCQTTCRGLNLNAVPLGGNNFVCAGIAGGASYSGLAYRGAFNNTNSGKCAIPGGSTALVSYKCLCLDKVLDAPQ
jgi:hypothetical protein